MAASPGAAIERPRAPLAVKVIAFVALVFLLESAREVVLPVAIAIILTFLLARWSQLSNRGLMMRGEQRCDFWNAVHAGTGGSRWCAGSEWIESPPTTVSSDRCV